MDGEAQEKALLEGRIDVGLFLWGERPVLQLLQVRHLLDYPVRVALPRTHPLVERSTLPLGLLREESFVGLNRLCPTYGEWLRTVCQREGFIPLVVKEADGASSALAFVAAGFGLAVVNAGRGGLEPRRGVCRRGKAVCGRPGAGLWAEGRRCPENDRGRRTTTTTRRIGNISARGPLFPLGVASIWRTGAKIGT